MTNEHDNDPADKKPKHTVNDIISYACKLAALVICVLIFATTILDQADATFVVLGLSLSVALIAIALLQDAHQKR